MPQTDYLPERIVINDHKQGDTFPGLEFIITRNSVVKDLTGSSITMTFLKGNSRSVSQVLTLGAGLTLTDPTNGIFEMDSIAVVDWEAGEYFYDMEIIYSDNEVKTPVEGTWKIVIDKTNNS